MRFPTQEHRAAVQSMLSAGVTCLTTPFTDHTTMPSASMADKRAGVYGRNIKNARVRDGGGASANHSRRVGQDSRVAQEGEHSPHGRGQRTPQDVQGPVHSHHPGPHFSTTQILRSGR